MAGRRFAFALRQIRIFLESACAVAETMSVCHDVVIIVGRFRLAVAFQFATLSEIATD
jgi:hypothetical protein